MTIHRLGNIEIHRVVDWEAPYLRPSEIFAEATDEALAPHLDWLVPQALCPETGRVIMPVQAYLLRTSRHTILIDSCIGCDKDNPWYKPWHLRRDETWLDRLAAAGAGPEDIDYVLCTHLHSDHCGWNTRLKDGRWVPTFPKARYVFSRREVAHVEAEGDSLFAESVAPVLEAGQAVLVDMDHALDDEVWLEPTPGHTPGHVAIRLSSQGQDAVMCGDLMHFPIQCPHPEWSPLFDHDLDEARQTRRRFLEHASETGTLVLTAHFPSPSVGRVRPKGETFTFDYLNG